MAWLYAHDKAFRVPYQNYLSAFIFEPSFRQQVGDALFTKAKLIKDLGNMAVHSQKKVLEADALSATRELFHFCFWLARRYGRTTRPDPGQAFSPALLPKAAAAPAPALTQPQLQKLSQELAQRNETLCENTADILGGRVRPWKPFALRHYEIIKGWLLHAAPSGCCPIAAPVPGPPYPLRFGNVRTVRKHPHSPLSHVPLRTSA